jgi:hypothetical protein
MMPRLQLVDRSTYGYRVYEALTDLTCRACGGAVPPGARVRRAGRGGVECEACWGVGGSTCSLRTCRRELGDTPRVLRDLVFCSKECCGRWLLDHD